METTNARGEKYKSVENMGGSKDFKNSGTNIKATKITKVYCKKLLWILIILKNYKNKIVRVANIVYEADVVRVA